MLWLHKEPVPISAVPFRVTCLSSLTRDDEDSTGGGCSTHSSCTSLWYIYKCSNGSVVEGIEQFCSYKQIGTCTSSGGGGSGGGSGAGYYQGSYGGATSGGGSSYSPVKSSLEGVFCGAKTYCPVDDECCKKKAREAVGSHVDLLNRKYSDGVRDMHIKIPGYTLYVKRLCTGQKISHVTI